MRRYRVLQEFQARERNGPFTRVVTTGEELMFMQWAGEEYEQSAIFAILVDGPAGVTPGPQYETPRDQFERSTEPVIS
jgi:hypothetical protein